MTRNVCLFMATVIFIASMQARAETPPGALTVKNLGEACSSSNPQVFRFCVGYVMGMGELMEANGTRLKHIPASDTGEIFYLHLAGICPAKGERLYPTGEAMVQAVRNWIAANPQKWNDSSQFGVMAALSTTWPCD